jgi:hypothetical protein
MKKLKFATLVARLMLQSLAHVDDAHSHDVVVHHVGSVSSSSGRQTAACAEDRRDYFPAGRDL